MYMDGTLPRLGCLNFVQNVYKLLLYKCTQNQFTVHVWKLVGISLNKLKVDIWKLKGEIQFWGHTDTRTHLTLHF